MKYILGMQNELVGLVTLNSSIEMPPQLTCIHTPVSILAVGNT